MNKLLLLGLLLGAVPAIAAPNTKLVSQSKAAVARQLKDPESARFRDVFVMRGSVCGEVNAKNSYGGYVGFKRFVVLDGDSSAVFMDDGERLFLEVYANSCLRNPPKNLPKPPEYYEESWSDMKKDGQGK